MLTAELEGGQRKCHPYWLPGDYGAFKLRSLSERRASLELPKRVATNPVFARSDSKASKSNAGNRPSLPNRSSTHHGSFSKSSPVDPSSDLEVPHVIIRKLSLSHADQPSESSREITQLQYSSWPDFGAPAHPAHVLGLVKHCWQVLQSYNNNGTSGARGKDKPAEKGERPVVVHCSAGCGRTGTFCTVDSVVDMLKRQRLHYRRARREQAEDGMDVDGEGNAAGDDGVAGQEWLARDDNDLVAKTVEDFRHQRLSTVQTLRQFVLCYESVLEWIAGEMEFEGIGGSRERPSMERMESGGRGKSYNG